MVFHRARHGQYRIHIESRKQLPNRNQDNQDILGMENTSSYNQPRIPVRIRDEPIQTRPC